MRAMTDPTAFPALVVAIIGAAIAAGALVVAIVSAVSSHRSSAAAERSADAAEAAVAEQRRANDLAVAERASRSAAWGEPRGIAQYRWEVANRGTAIAYRAYLTHENGSVDDLRPPRDVEPGDGLSFACANRGTPTNRAAVRVHWQDADGTEHSVVRAV